MKSISLTQNQSIILLILLAALFTLGAAIYSYTGPNRTVTIQDNSACVWERSTCQWNERFDEYRWHVTGSVPCASESKPWLSGDDYHGTCNEAPGTARSGTSRTTARPRPSPTRRPPLVRSRSVPAPG